MDERLLRCDVCGTNRKHVLLGPHWERDEHHRKFHRYRCSVCKAHSRVYEDQHTDDEQTNGCDSEEA